MGKVAGAGNDSASVCAKKAKSVSGGPAKQKKEGKVEKKAQSVAKTKPRKSKTVSKSSSAEPEFDVTAAFEVEPEPVTRISEADAAINAALAAAAERESIEAEPAVQKLLEYGKERKTISYDELSDFLPDHVTSGDRIEIVLALLERNNIQLVEDDVLGFDIIDMVFANIFPTTKSVCFTTAGKKSP